MIIMQCPQRHTQSQTHWALARGAQARVTGTGLRAAAVTSECGVRSPQIGVDPSEFFYLYRE